MEHANVLIDPSTWHFKQLGPCAYRIGLLRTREWMTHAKPLKAQHSTAHFEFYEQHITCLTSFFLRAKRT